MTPAPSPPDSPLTTDLPCAKCHYNLRTKKPSEICPECAHPVADSITFRRNAALRNPKRAALGSLLLAFAFLQGPLFQLAFFIVFHWLDLTHSTRSFQIPFTTSEFLTLSSACIGFFLFRSGVQSARPGLASRLFAILVVYHTLLLPTATLIISLLSPWTYYTPTRTSPDTWTVFAELIPFPSTFIIFITAWWFLRRLARRLHRPAFALIISCLIPAHLLLQAFDLLTTLMFYSHAGYAIVGKWPYIIFAIDLYSQTALLTALALYLFALAPILRNTPAQSPLPDAAPS